MRTGGATFQKKHDELFACEDWRSLRALLQQALRRDPSDHWLLTRIGLTFYEERRYKESLQWSRRALKIAPRCPLVLWDYAGALDMLGREREAIAVWKKLLRRGIDAIAYGECGEGTRWATSLLNDARYRIANTYKDLGMRHEAIRYYRDHIQHRQPGLPSTYPKALVVRELKELEASR